MEKIFEVKIKGYVKNKEKTLSILVQDESYDSAAENALNLCVLNHKVLHSGARVLSVAEKEYSIVGDIEGQYYYYLAKFKFETPYEEVYSAERFKDCYDKILKLKKEYEETTGVAFTDEMLSLVKKNWAAVYRYDAELFVKAAANMLRLRDGLFYEPKEGEAA